MIGHAEGALLLSAAIGLLWHLAGPSPRWRAEQRDRERGAADV